MKVISKQNEFGLSVFLVEDKKCISFTFEGNLDLYWSIHNIDENISDDYKYDSFIITKENYGVYKLFEELFYNMENINIFDVEDDVECFAYDEERIEYLKKRRIEIEKMKERYRLYNISHYNELFDADTKTITWYSDETSYKVSNILKIIKENNIFKLEFYTQPHIDGYDADSHYTGFISIRFRNSGSSYEPFNLIFMKMYNDMYCVDDTSDIGHQFHIDEYLYDRENVKSLIKL